MPDPPHPPILANRSVGGYSHGLRLAILWGYPMAKKKKGVRWGFDWGKVATGGLMLLVGGGITLVGLLFGRIIIWPAILAVVGLFTMINGLMGEEGIW